ncbi:hypothetical protein CBS101457_005047 [Exobasidium rhododendri]|nr:hypothetical protein CBS101457_005047 [Exobasidium rhododendri]
MEAYELEETGTCSTSTSTDVGDLEPLIGQDQAVSFRHGREKWSLGSVGRWYHSEDDTVTAKKVAWSPVDPMAHTFIPALEGLRGMAVSFTVVSHCLPGPQNLRDAIGSMGVTIFFVLSGFLITAVLIRVEDGAASRQAYFARFYADRFFRLAPALLFLIVLHYGWHYLYFWPDDKAKMNRYSLLAITYLSNIRSLELPETSGPFPQLWSLACEEQFYIIWSIVLPFLLARRNVTRGLLIVTAIALSIATRLYVTMYPGVLGDMDWYSALPLNVYKMLFGSLLRLVPVPSQVKKTGASYVGLLLMAATVYLTYLPQPRYENYFPGWEHHFKPVLTWTDILTTLSTSLVLCSVSTSPKGNFLLEWSPLKFVGRVSYAWYLWQIPILFLSHNTYTMWPAMGDSAVAFLFAMFSTIYVEEPINSYYKAWRKNRQFLSLDRR